MGAYWQTARKFTVAPGATMTFHFPQERPLERLTVWANSGLRIVGNVTFQARINGAAYNPSVTIVGARAADVVYRSGGAATENDMIPFIPFNQIDSLDPFDFTIDITNNDVTSVDITMMAVAIHHTG